MRKLILKMDVSLDGFVGGPNGESEWIFETCDEGCTIWEVETISQAGLHVMGRKSFETMASYWPSSTNPFAAAMNSIPKLVFSRSGKVDFDTISRAAQSQDLKAANAQDEKNHEKHASPEDTKKNQKSCASQSSRPTSSPRSRAKRPNRARPSSLTAAPRSRALIKHDLIDEYRLVVHPVALGNGLKIFDGLEKPLALKLVSCSTFPSGATAKIFARVR